MFYYHLYWSVLVLNCIIIYFHIKQRVHIFLYHTKQVRRYVICSRKYPVENWEFIFIWGIEYISFIIILIQMVRRVFQDSVYLQNSIKLLNNFLGLSKFSFSKEKTNAWLCDLNVMAKHERRKLGVSYTMDT